MDRCISLIKHYLEEQTDGLLRRKDSKNMPIVGESPLIKFITNVNKANFIVEAHTGAGKTTLGLTLYHKARFGQLQEYDVIYVNSRGVLEILRKDNYENKLLNVIFNHTSEKYKELEKENYIYSTISLDIFCNNIEQCLQEYSSKYPNKKLIIVLDELERVLDWRSIENLINNWFVSTRKFYDKYGKVQVKVVVMLPKILESLRTIRQSLQNTSEAALLFTEFREVSVDEDVLLDYVYRLGKRIGGCLEQLPSLKGFRHLIKILGHLRSGRLSVPPLWNAISFALCQALKEVMIPETSNVSNWEELSQEIEKHIREDCKELPDINADMFVDPIIVGITEGKPFRGKDRSQTIEMWERGFRSICEKLGYSLKPYKFGYQDFLCRAGNVVIWMTLKKDIKIDDLRKIGSYIYKELGRVEAERGTVRFKVLALVPEFTQGSSEREITIEGVEHDKKKPKKIAINILFNYRILTIEELLAIAHMGYKSLSVDTNISNSIIEELIIDIGNQLR